MQSVGELEQKIRAFINNPRIQHALQQDAAAWNLLCSCLDTIGDTELAIDAYERSGDPSTIGATYLMVYGALQALFVQQDAVENLCQALAIEYVADSKLNTIREIRNDSAGHPTKRGGGTGRSYNFISRSSLTNEGFDLITTFPDSRPPLFRRVIVGSLIEGQKSVLHRVLSEVLERLKKEEADHRAKYRDQRLQDVFPSTLGYHFEKINEAAHGSKPPEIGTIHISLISDTIDLFKERMEQRGTLEAYDSLAHLIELIEYPIKELSNYFIDTKSCPIGAKGAYIFAYFIQRHIEELKSMAKEIDETYENEP